MTDVYPDGSDCVWVAIDQNGSLAAFVTAGEGPIPTAFLKSGYVLESIEDIICNLAITSEARLLASMPRPDDFINMAERGFYVYDWTDIDRTANEVLDAYELVAAPINPTNIEMQSTDIKELVAIVKLEGIVYAEKQLIPIKSLIECTASAVCTK